MERILLVSNDQSHGVFLKGVLEERKLPVSAVSFEAAFGVLAHETYGAVLVDFPAGTAMGPGMIAALRARTPAPILCLVGSGVDLEGLVQCGAAIEDFLFRPVRTEEFGFRIRRLLAIRCNRERQGVPLNGHGLAPKPADAPAPARSPFRIDDFAKRIYFRDTPLQLTLREFTLLRALAKSPGRVFSNAEILAAVWPQSRRASASDVQQYIHRLRKKLGEATRDSSLIVTIKGFGYRLEAAGAET